MDLKLAGRSVLVTGASQGIGLAVAQWFAAEGCAVHLAARSGPALEREAAAIRARHRVAASAHAVDLASESGRAQLAAACPDVDVLVNNAGDIPAGTLEEIDDAKLRAGWELKLFGYVSLTRHYLARMKARRRGVIVNIIGAAGERPAVNYLAGSMANVSLMAMTVAIGANSIDEGVRVVGVNPGAIATDRVVKLARHRAARRLGDAERYRELYSVYPLGRPGTPDEVAAAVVFLASDLSSYTTGTILTIDGGHMRRPGL